MQSAAGPTLLGFDVIWIATMLSAVATLAVLIAIYAATTVRDPMAKRVKALNERREQLKAGIVASTNRRKSLTNKNEAADKVRGVPDAVQDAPGRAAQEDPDQAGPGRHPLQGAGLLHHFRAPRAADRLRHGRGGRALRPRLVSRMGRAAPLLHRRRHPRSVPTRRPTSGSRTRSPSAARRSTRASPTRSTCWSSAPRPASPSTPPSAASPANWARPIPNSATNSA